MQKHRRGFTEAIGIILLIAIAGLMIMYRQGYNVGVIPNANSEGGGLFNFDIILNVPESDGGSDIPITPPVTPPLIPPDNFRVPTQLTVFINPSSIETNEPILGEVVSNGYNQEVTIYAKHLGSGIETAFIGWLGADGKFSHAQIIGMAGYYEFWAIHDGKVMSNVATLEVRGFQVIQNGHYSGSSGAPYPVEIYSHMSGDALVFLMDAEMGTSIPLSPDIQVNTGGYGIGYMDMGGIGAGDYEVDSYLDGRTASSWGGTSWVTVGR